MRHPLHAQLVDAKSLGIALPHPACQPGQLARLGRQRETDGGIALQGHLQHLPIMPGAAQGPAKLGHSPPALPKLVSRGGRLAVRHDDLMPVRHR